MTYLDYYTINVTLNNKSEEVDPKNVSFSLKDNIYSLYNTASFTFRDTTGLFQEYLSTTEGVKVKIGYGTKETINACSYVNKYDLLDAPETQGFLNGNVDMFLVNEWYNKQQVRSKAYENRISKVIQTLIDKENFTSEDIDSTGNEDIWYQCLTTDAKFINEILLPKAYSRNAKDSPFFCFITCDNVFHLRNYYSMTNTNIVATIDYKASRTKEEESEFDKISAIKRWHQSSDIHRPLRSRYIFRISSTDGTLDAEEKDITDHPPKNNLNLPILHDLGYKTGFQDLGFSQTNTGPKENNLGSYINTMKPSLFLDRFLIILPLHPKITSGKMIQLNTYIAEGENKISTNFSGEYLVEECEHIWNNETQRGYTKLIVGRHFIKVPNAYLLKPELL
jgi:hypothetical protein